MTHQWLQADIEELAAAARHGETAAYDIAARARNVMEAVQADALRHGFQGDLARVFEEARARIEEHLTLMGSALLTVVDGVDTSSRIYPGADIEVAAVISSAFPAGIDIHSQP